MTLRAGTRVDVVKVEAGCRYRLKLTFSDGHVSAIDFESFLRHSLNPDTSCFLNERRFREFALVDGNLVWGDYEMCSQLKTSMLERFNTRPPAVARRPCPGCPELIRNRFPDGTCRRPFGPA